MSIKYLKTWFLGTYQLINSMYGLMVKVNILKDIVKQGSQEYQEESFELPITNKTLKAIVLSATLFQLIIKNSTEALITKNTTITFESLQPTYGSLIGPRVQIGQTKTSQPGVEPGSRVPETLMLPLHHWDVPGKSMLLIISPYCLFEYFLKSDVPGSHPHHARQLGLLYQRRLRAHSLGIRSDVRGAPDSSQVAGQPAIISRCGSHGWTASPDSMHPYIRRTKSKLIPFRVQV
jgi:hypothetical protein